MGFIAPHDTRNTLYVHYCNVGNTCYFSMKIDKHYFSRFDVQID